MSDRLDRILATAVAAGLIPSDAERPLADARPWPVLLLTALGAWLAAIPLLAGVGLLLADWLAGDLGLYLAGVLILAAAVMTLRARDLPLFVEQFAVPALLVGLGALGFGLGRDLPPEAAAGLIAILAVALAAVLPRPWLRVLLGAAAGGLFALAVALALAAPRDLLVLDGSGRPWGWLALQVTLAPWLIGLWVQPRLLGPRTGAAAALESIGAGWLLATLAGLALVSGMTLLAGAGLSPLVRDLATELSARYGAAPEPIWMAGGSALLVLVAMLWGARVWPGLRRPWVLGLGAAVAGLAWFLPSLGGVWLALVITATSGRRRLAGAAALAAAWIIGSFYYQLQWPLAQKALVLVTVGGLLGLLVRLGGGLGRRTAPRSAAFGSTRGWAPWLIALSVLATLGVVNVAIWQKESLIAAGRPVFVALAPVDPRSLMQGDFMRLRFGLPAGIDDLGRLSGGRPRVVAQADARGVATLLRLHHADEPLAADEFLIALTPKDGRWTLVTDAWFFREGDAARWQAARFGAFRVAPDGEALLVGMADAQLQPIAAGD